jgi:hypothetical protein
MELNLLTIWMLSSLQEVVIYNFASLLLLSLFSFWNLVLNFIESLFLRLNLMLKSNPMIN